MNQSSQKKLWEKRSRIITKIRGHHKWSHIYWAIHKQCHPNIQLFRLNQSFILNQKGLALFSHLFCNSCLSSQFYSSSWDWIAFSVLLVQKTWKISCLQEESRPYCTLCEYAIGEMDKLITDKKNMYQVKAALDRICYELSTPIQKQCLKMVDTYTGFYLKINKAFWIIHYLYNC